MEVFIASDETCDISRTSDLTQKYEDTLFCENVLFYKKGPEHYLLKFDGFELYPKLISSDFIISPESLIVVVVIISRMPQG